MLMAGTKDMDRQVLQERMDALGVSISSGGGGRGRGGRGGGGGGGRAGQLSFSVDANASRWCKAFTCLVKSCVNRRSQQRSSSRCGARTINRMKSMETGPGALAGDKLSRALSQYPASDPRFVPTTAESIAEMEKLTLDQVVSIYKSSFPLRSARFRSSAI